MKKLLVVAYQFPPYGGGGSIRVYNFCKFFREFGWEPHVLSITEDFYDETYISPELLKELEGKIHLYRSSSYEPKAKEFRNKVYGLQKTTAWDRIKIGMAKPIVNRVMVPDRNILWYPKAVSLGNKVIRERGIDAVFSTAPPFTSHLVARSLAKGNRIPYYLDYRDDWVGNPNFMKYGGLTAAANRYLEKTVVKGAKKIFCATEKSREFILEKYGQDLASKVVYLSNGFDPAFLDLPSDRGQSGSRDLNLLHMGTLTPNRSPISLVHAMKLLEQSNPDRGGRTNLLLFGYTHQLIKDKIEEMGMARRVRYRDNVAYNEVPKVLSEECDVALSIQSSKIGGDTAIPGKIYEYMAVRKPILNISERGAVWKFLEDRGSTHNASYDDPSDIHAMLLRLHEEKDAGRLKASIPDAEINRFNRKELTRFLCEELAGTPRIP